MKILPIQQNKISNLKIVKNIKKIDVNKYRLNPDCIEGSISGLCAGGILGYGFALSSFLIGISMSLAGAICSILVGTGVGTYLGNKIESKINDTKNNK